MNQSFYLPATANREGALGRIATILKGLPLGMAWTLEIKAFKARRSNQQNRYLHGVVYPAILKAGGETLGGWSAQELHEYFLGEKFGWEIIEGFGLKRRRPFRRSSKLDKLEFVEFVQFIQQRMAEHGIYVPDPNEDMP